jgi:hypothetical protein
MLFDEILFELAEHAPARARRPAARLDADIDHRLLDDGADVEAVALREQRMGQPPQSLRRFTQLGVMVVALQRITARRHEIHHAVEIRPRQLAIGRRRNDLRVQRVGNERRATRHA